MAALLNLCLWCGRFLARRLNSLHPSQVFQEMWKAPEKRVEHLVKELDLGLISDQEELVKICQRVMDAHPDLVRLTFNNT